MAALEQHENLAATDLEICADEILIRAVETINDSKKNFAVMVAGERKIGKSTFCRKLMNKLLGSGLSVFHLECDPGQTEFTPPACLALTEIVERVGELPFKHLRTPISCRFFGETTPANRTDDYISCIQELLSDFQRISAEESPSCLVVNTSGWIRGAGLVALREICRAAKPNQTVLICQSGRKEDSTAAAFEAICSTLEQIADVESPMQCHLVEKALVHGGCNLTASEFREAALLTHFGCQLSENEPHLERAKEKLSVNIRGTTPYVVPMNRFYVNVVHGIPPPNYILSILNASVVALCRYETEDDDGESADMHWLGDNSLPMVLKENVSKIQCLGFGFIRAINMDTRSFYLVTPLPKEKLAYVNAFLKGDISLPSAVFKCQQPILRKQNQIPQPLPYMMSGKSTRAIADDELVLKALDDELVLKRFRKRKETREQEKVRLGLPMKVQKNRRKEKNKKIQEKKEIYKKIQEMKERPRTKSLIRKENGLYSRLQKLLKAKKAAEKVPESEKNKKIQGKKPQETKEQRRNKIKERQERRLRSRLRKLLKATKAAEKVPEPEVIQLEPEVIQLD